MTKLIEFKNQNSEVLRGILDEADSEKGIIFVHGFERTTVEMKFKNIADALKGKANLFRFDFSGCGLSDGKFENLTVAKLAGELAGAIEVFKKNCFQVKNILLVAHSLAGCIVLKILSENERNISKVIFLSPAFNQKELMRYWFAVSQMKKENIQIGWDNFRKYLADDRFQEDLAIKKRMTKAHELFNDYFLQNSEIDFQDFFGKISLQPENILIIHGDADDKVPIQSNNLLPQGINIIKVAGGDHDLERIDMVKQYLEKAVGFLS